MKKIYIWTIGSFCLGFSLTGIYGLLDGTILAIGVICMVKVIEE